MKEAHDFSRGRSRTTFGTVADQRRAAAAAFGFTLVGWLAFVVPLYTSFRALGVSLPLGVVLLAVPAAGLANAVPLPGGLGGAELALGGTLVALAGLDIPTAAAGVLLYRLCAFWFLAALGGGCAAALRVRVGDLAAGVDDPAAPTGP
ncbi:MAG: flippase-like domain-containing protein [Haloferacaceae archaeon]